MALQVEKQKHDAAMEELKLKHSIQMDYMQHMGDEKEKARLLRMIIATSSDEKVVAWAKEEKTAVDKAVADAEAQLKEATSGRELAEQKLGAQTALTEEQRKARAASEQRAGQLASEIRSKTAELNRIQCTKQQDSCIADEIANHVPQEAGKFAHYRCLRAFLDCKNAATPE